VTVSVSKKETGGELMPSAGKNEIEQDI